MKIIRTFSTALLALGMALAGSPGFAADPYPTKPVTLMVPYPPGGLSDSIARALSTPLGKALGQGARQGATADDLAVMKG